MEDVYIEKVKQGDVEAFRFIIRQYQHMAFSVALSVVKNEFLAQEVVQEAFLSIYQNIRQFKGKSKFSTWMYRIVVNKAYRLLEKEGRHKGEVIEVVDDEKDDENGLDIMADDERKYFINKALVLMPPNESVALRLFYLQEMALQEITEVTGWSMANVKVILHRARKRFHSQLNDLLKNEAKSIM